MPLALYKDSAGQLVIASSLPSGGSSVADPSTDADHLNLAYNNAPPAYHPGVAATVVEHSGATLPSHTVATLPPATSTEMIFVSNESGGAVAAFSDGTNWRRVTDRAVVS